MEALLRLLAVVIVPIGLVVGWKLAPYSISSFDEFVSSRFEIWLKKLGFAIGCGFGPAILLWNLGGGDVFNKHGHSVDKPTSAAVASNSKNILPTPSVVNSMKPNETYSSANAGVVSPELSGHSVQAGNPVPTELDVDMIIAEKRASLMRAHPACTEIFKQEELNPGDNDLQCSNLEFEVADKELNTIYKLARANLLAERKAVLKKEQIAWIKDKERFCEEETKAAMTPRFRDAANNFCLADLTRKRTEHLKRFR